MVITLTPFFKCGFTTADDLEFYIRALKGGLLEDAYWYARGQGRFYFLFMKPLYHFPYLIDNFYFTKTIQYGFLILSFILFSVVIRKIFLQKELSIFIFLLLFAFLSIVRPFCFLPVTAYPFYFSFSFSLLMVALLFLIKYYETTQYHYLIISIILSALVILFYETYLIFLFFICLFIFLKTISILGKQTFKNKRFYKEIIPFITIGIIYIIVYVLYRANVQNVGVNYGGAAIATHFNIYHFFKILWNYNLCAIPTYAYYDSQNIMVANSLLTSGHQNNFWYIITHTSVISVVNTLIQCFIFFFLCYKMRNRISWKKIILAILALILLTFSSHLLLAISEKYNPSVGWSSHKGYITTFFSYFFITSLIAFLIYSGIKACYKYKWLKNSFIVMATLSLFFVSTIIGYSNDHLSRDYALTQNSFEMVEKSIKKGMMNDIPDEAIIYSKELCSTSATSGNVIFMQSKYVWRDFIYIKTKKKMNIYDVVENIQENFSDNTQQPIYYISYFDSPKNQDRLLVLSRMNNESINPDEGKNMLGNATANEAKVYYYAPYKEFVFELFIPFSTQPSTIFINDIEYKAIQGINAIKIKNEKKNEEIISFTIKSSEPFLVNKFAVSNLGFVQSIN